MREFDAIVVGAGPNGLSAAIVLARAGLRVLVREANDAPGGGARTEPLTQPGFLHDVCSAVHPLGIASPFFRRLPLQQYGLEWVQPPVPIAHPMDDGTAVLLERSVDRMDAQLGADARAWQRLMAPFVDRWQDTLQDTLGPLKVPRHPLLLARFGLAALPATTWLARRVFRGQRARGLFAGMSAHATLPLGTPPSAAFGLILGLAGHAVGWPIARGGSASITRALVAYLRSLGGELETAAPVLSLDDLPPARAVLLDLTPRQILRLHGTRLSQQYRAQLKRFRPGWGRTKSTTHSTDPFPGERRRSCARGPCIWAARSKRSKSVEARSGQADQPSVHTSCWFSQRSLIARERRPGKHVAWAYCHVPNGSTFDVTDPLEDQIDRFAPGFRERVIARHVMGPLELERHNANLVGGDINGGEATLMQLFFRPALQPVPYATPNPKVFICSASTPPGGAYTG